MGQSSVNCTCRLGVCLWEFTPVGLFQEIRVVQYTWSVTGHQTDDGSWWIAMTHHRLSVCDMSAIKRHLPRLYKCLWRRYFRMRNIVTLLCLVCSSCLQVTNRHPFWQPVTDRVYWTCMQEIPWFTYHEHFADKPYLQISPTPSLVTQICKKKLERKIGK